MMKCLLLLSTFLVLAHGAEECMNTENSVSVTSDTDNICPMQSVTARCVVNTVSQTGEDFVLVWECNDNGSTTDFTTIVCSSNAEVFPLECNSGRVNLTWISCTCDNSVLTSDATFLATRGSELLTCAFYNTSDQVEIHGTVSFGIKDPLTPVISLNSSHIYDVENNSCRNVTIEWSSSGSEQYQYRVSISSPNSDPVTTTTSATTINVTLEIGVDYGITVTAERCSGSVTSNTSEPFLVILPVPDRVEECGAVPVYNETTLDHVNLEWEPLPENNHVAIGVTVDLMGYELTFTLNATVSTEVPVPASEFECATACRQQSMPFPVFIAGKNRFSVGQTTSCTGDNEIGLRNIFLNVTEFNKTTISIVLVGQKNINVSCGKERNNLMLCANAKGSFEKHAHLNTSDHYMLEFEPNTVYYYEIETETIIVFGSITSNNMTSSADSSLNVGLVIRIVVAIVAVGPIVVWVAVGLLGLLINKTVRVTEEETARFQGKMEISDQQETTHSLMEMAEMAKTSDQEGFDAAVILISGPLTPVTTTEEMVKTPENLDQQETPRFQGKMEISDQQEIAQFQGERVEISKTPDQQEMEETQNTYNYNGQEIKGLCATEKMLICSDKVQDDERGIVIGFERVEKRLNMKWKITGLSSPRGVAVDSNGKFVYVVESGNNRIIKFNIEKFTYVCESSGTLKFILPRGIIAKHKWIFVCDTGKNRIQILDEDLNFHSIIKTSEDDIINAPNDIECIFDENSMSYTLYVATNISTIVVLEVYLDSGQTIAAGKKIIQLNNMDIDLQTNIMRSICIIEERYIFVTEMCIAGRIICLDLENEGSYVEELTRKSSEATCPTMIAHCGNTVIYCEIYKGQHAGCHILYFDV